METRSEFHVDIVGLGSMGMGAVLSYVHAGLSTWDADLNNNACATLKEAGVYGASDNAATLAERLGALLVLVVNMARVKQVLFGEAGVAQHLKPGMAAMVSSTITSADAQEIATALAGFDLEMLGAPVSGGVIKAANGEMTVMASGSDITFERLAPILEAVTGKAHRIDAEPGLGLTVKIIHQLLVGVHIVAGAEVMVLAARAGTPLNVMYDVTTNAAGNSWMFESRVRHVVDDDYTPYSAVGISVKDPGLVTDTAETLRFPLSLTSTALNMFTSASNAGYGREDDDAIIRISSGITLPGAKS